MDVTVTGRELLLLTSLVLPEATVPARQAGVPGQGPLCLVFIS